MIVKWMHTYIRVGGMLIGTETLPLSVWIGFDLTLTFLWWNIVFKLALLIKGHLSLIVHNIESSQTFAQY